MKTLLVINSSGRVTRSITRHLTTRFATLLTKDKQFLAQAYSVQYVASGRDLLRELKLSTAKEVVLFANPDFGLASRGLSRGAT